MLDMELAWKKHLDNEINIAYRAFWMRRSRFEKDRD
jgi:hypothetical protein